MSLETTFIRSRTTQLDITFVHDRANQYEKGNMKGGKETERKIWVRIVRKRNKMYNVKLCPNQISCMCKIYPDTSSVVQFIHVFVWLIGGFKMSMTMCQLDSLCDYHNKLKHVSKNKKPTNIRKHKHCSSTLKTVTFQCELSFTSSEGSIKAHI